jgi:hypothetical protein
MCGPVKPAHRTPPYERAVLQFAENLTDRAAAHRVRYGMDLKYALGLELHDPGFDASVLSEFRTRLVEHGMEEKLLDLLLTALKDRGLVKAGGKQRTDGRYSARARVRGPGRSVQNGTSSTTPTKRSPRTEGLPLPEDSSDSPRFRAHCPCVAGQALASANATDAPISADAAPLLSVHHG